MGVFIQYTVYNGYTLCQREREREIFGINYSFNVNKDDDTTSAHRKHKLLLYETT